MAADVFKLERARSKSRAEDDDRVCTWCSFDGVVDVDAVVGPVLRLRVEFRARRPLLRRRDQRCCNGAAAETDQCASHGCKPSSYDTAGQGEQPVTRLQTAAMAAQQSKDVVTRFLRHDRQRYALVSIETQGQELAYHRH